MKKRFNRRKSKNEVDVDITSLLDILTILLVFLLKSYNPSDFKLELASKLEIADSQARDMTQSAPVIQVNKESKVFVNNKEIGIIPQAGEMHQLITFLKKGRQADLEKIKTTKASEKQNSELVNLIFDKELDYSIVQRVMHDSALAGYSKFKFIVKGNN